VTREDISISTCGFCAKTHAEAEILFVGGGGYAICDECIGLIMSILASTKRDLFEKLVDEARNPSDSENSNQDATQSPGTDAVV